MLPNFIFLPPYDGWSLSGPYLDKKSNRYKVGLTKNGKRIQINYARFLVEIGLGRLLNPNEDVHHKDEDPLNDNIDNLEIVAHNKHRRLHAKGITYYEFICKNCKRKFKKKLNREYTYCSISCGIIWRNTH